MLDVGSAKAVGKDNQSSSEGSHRSKGMVKTFNYTDRPGSICINRYLGSCMSNNAKRASCHCSLKDLFTYSHRAIAKQTSKVSTMYQKLRLHYWGQYGLKDQRDAVTISR